jgi:hypothetical protein
MCAAIALMLSSCSGSEDKTTTTDTMSSDSTPAMDSMSAGKDAAMAMNNEINPPMNLMVMTHKVANYDKWKAVYDAHDSARLASGLHNYAISRRQPDSNTVVVAVRVDNVDSAMAFSKNSSLKAAMKKGGVMGAPDIHYYKVVYDVNTTIPTDMRAIQSFTVKDWDAWKKAFEANRQLRLDNGFVERSYGYDAKDNHKVMLVLAMTDTAKANAFMKSDVIKQKREESGVTGPVDIKMIRLTARY